MLIIIAEALFWVLIVVGLVTRYWLQRPVVGKWLLIGVPVVDLLLIMVVIIELRLGKPVALAHQLAGIYLGISVVLGPSIVRWCDRKARAWRTGEEVETSRDNTFSSALRSEVVFLAKWILAMTVGFLVNQGLVLLAIDEGQREALSQASTMPFMSVLFVAIFGPGWILIFGNKSNKEP